ncbi:hypothetical protein P154DRAFT_443884, partial [Amniculicola lignicola CBS 123094]
EPLRHTREPGKVTAYLIPFPKPRIKGVTPEDIPERFLVYTPPNPPLSKPAPGEKESGWHKTQRTWQEDVRKAAMSKATGTDTISSSASTPPTKPQPLSELTLVYPPSLALPPEKIRSEFVDSLLRTRESSRKDAIVASSLIPLAATIDAALIVTLGGLTEVSGVWAYTSIRGTLTSKKMTEGLALAEERDHKCKKGKAKKTAIDMRMQQSGYVEILRRYLELACVKKEFHMFPNIEEMAGDVNEAALLDAIGWQPTRRSGADLEMEFNNKVVEKLTAEQDEYWQRQEAQMDVKRLMKKGAAEWVTWCKALGKDPEAAMKK